jgi:urea carboxylase
MGCSVWAHSAGVGQRVFAGNVIIILESMKVEVPIEAPCDGEVTWLAAVGQTLETDDLVAVVNDALVAAPP